MRIVRQFPAWHVLSRIGPRAVDSLKAQGVTIRNKLCESTISVARPDIEDDKPGMFRPAFSKTGQAARKHPQELVFGLLKDGFTGNCFDGQFFFDIDHPVVNGLGDTPIVSTMQAGAGPAWYLLDTSRAVRPIIWQERIPCEVQTVAAGGDSYVFFNDGYIHGEWTTTAREMIGAHAYRCLGPSIVYDAATKAIVRLKGAGLVHNPNLHLTALANQDDDAMIPKAPAMTLAQHRAALLKLPHS